MFTPIETSIGAYLLHEAATGFLFNNGAVMGASGLLRELLLMRSTRSILFISGMASSVTVLNMLVPEVAPTYPALNTASWQSIAFALGMGVLTGAGTKVLQTRSSVSLSKSSLTRM